MSEHPNAARAREGFERFVQGDLPALLDLFADDAVWHVPGSMALSGEHRGRDAIIAFLRGDGRAHLEAPSCTRSHSIGRLRRVLGDDLACLKRTSARWSRSRRP